MEVKWWKEKSTLYTTRKDSIDDKRIDDPNWNINNDVNNGTFPNRRGEFNRDNRLPFAIDTWEIQLFNWQQVRIDFFLLCFEEGENLRFVKDAEWKREDSIDMGEGDNYDDEVITVDEC